MFRKHAFYKAPRLCYWRYFDFTLVLWYSCRMQVSWLLNWGTPGPRVFSKYIKIIFSTAELMQANKESIFAVVVHSYFLQRTVLIQHTCTLYISTVLFWNSGVATTGISRGGGGKVPPAATCKHARKRSEKPAYVFGFSCSYSAISRSQTPSAEEGNALFFISFI